MRRLARTATAGIAAAGVFLLAPAAHGATGEAEPPETSRTETDATPDREVLTAVDRDQDLDPTGDEVTVVGTGYTPHATVRVQLWVLPEGHGEIPEDGPPPPDGAPDAERTVDIDVDARGVFSTDLDVATDFAHDAGFDPETDPFELRVWSPDEDPAEEDPAADTVAASVPTDPARLPLQFAAAQPAAAPASPAAPGDSDPPADSSGAESPANAPASPREEEGSGGQELSVSKTSDLDPDGETVTVTGSGYDTSKGIYVALCDVSGASSSQPPSPCLGGVDMEGEGGHSVWISSNPPPYGEGLAEPYDGSGTDGGFTVQLRVQAADEFTDCLDSGTECAVATRNDHTRGSDRGQDVFVPVTFAGQDGSGGSEGSGGSGDDSDAGGGPNSANGGAGPSGSGSSGSLPRTGAALAGLVAVATAACVAGGATMRLARRRSTTR
ncbi:cell wall protein [Spiractinospora alimapuensis]|uniref:cell wall protein n=1 Tax=Spiractinospora alimapuensis TaxID=2820884 RepID=UPI001F342F95|nr:cell wall protein [Spiractinospora alimapuensis]QVQ54198.1 cell wall protein [Spiractinospora alimapuensis]